MKIATISHSHVHLRQQLFFKEIARQGHDVLMLSPRQWGNLRAEDYEETFKGFIPGPFYDSKFIFKTCRHMGDNIYNYLLLDINQELEKFCPDWLYVQAEPGSATADEAIRDLKADKKALFTWENIRFEPAAMQCLRNYDLVVCGNPDAERLAKPHSKRTALMLQVGIDTNHFAARPDIERSVPVGFVGRMVPEKGLPYLKEAWPTVQFITGIDYREIPWYYSQLQVLVAYSQDIPWWREQAPNYTVLEALSCGCKAVTSDTAAMVYWLDGCPGVVHVKGCEQPTDLINPIKSEWLKLGIIRALDTEIDNECRQWVIDRFSNPVLAENLIKEFENA